MHSQHNEVVRKRFEKDAKAFDAIYQCKKSEFSGWFNRLFRKPIFERYDIAFEAMGDLRNKSILDVGCGSGVYAIQCAMKGAKRVKGVDFSYAMLKIAKERAEVHHLNDQCEFELIDFMQMEKQEQFDCAIAMGVFDYLPDPLPFLKHLKSLTKTRIIASFPGHSLIREPLRKLRYLLTSKGTVFFYRQEDIQKLVDQVKFSHVEIRPLKTGSGFILIADI
ncbi:MAG: class I SAM-dependent methyltransferase [Gammaproteobacteria bacterium]|nr:class I SAM-dependent methyltransferase [Gammaproteobacteria bacterium]